MAFCPNCGTEIEEGKKFCRMCGTPVDLTTDEITTWRLPPKTSPETSHPTMPVAQGPTMQPSPGASQVPPPGPSYAPPAGPSYAPPPGPTYSPPPAYYPSVPPASPPAVPHPGQSKISLGNWLSGGWQVYKENWLLMSLATMFGAFLSVCTIGILAGPLLMGMFRMAFKTMRGERPEMGDLFNWEGRFLQSFLTFLIFALVHGGLTGIGNSEALAAILTLIVTPILTVMLGLTMPMVFERRVDVANAINEVSRSIFSRDALMWWVVGLVFATISVGGFFGCGVGVLITLPWIISSSAVAYRDVFGIDDPNRTLP